MQTLCLWFLTCIQLQSLFILTKCCCCECWSRAQSSSEPHRYFTDLIYCCKVDHLNYCINLGNCYRIDCDAESWNSLMWRSGCAFCAIEWVPHCQEDLTRSCNLTSIDQKTKNTSLQPHTSSHWGLVKGEWYSLYFWDLDSVSSPLILLVVHLWN